MSSPCCGRPASSCRAGACAVGSVRRAYSRGVRRVTRIAPARYRRESSSGSGRTGRSFRIWAPTIWRADPDRSKTPAAGSAPGGVDNQWPATEAIFAAARASSQDVIKHARTTLFACRAADHMERQCNIPMRSRSRERRNGENPACRAIAPPAAGRTARAAVPPEKVGARRPGRNGRQRQRQGRDPTQARRARGGRPCTMAGRRRHPPDRGGLCPALGGGSLRWCFALANGRAPMSLAPRTPAGPPGFGAALMSALSLPVTASQGARIEALHGLVDAADLLLGHWAEAEHGRAQRRVVADLHRVLAGRVADP